MNLNIVIITKDLRKQDLDLLHAACLANLIDHAEYFFFYVIPFQYNKNINQIDQHLRNVHRLVLKTGGLVDVIGEALKGARIKVAFVFGSVADGKATAASDVDLMVVGSLGLRELTSLLAGTAEKLGREINPHILTEVEYQERIERADHFVTNVLSGPKLFVVGSQDDLEAMGGERLAQT